MARRSEIIWKDQTLYWMHVGARGRARVVEWIVNVDRTQVQALADDGQYHPLHALIPPASKTRRPRWVVPTSDLFKGKGHVAAPPEKWMPPPGGETEKQLLEGKIGTPRQQRAYAKRKKAIEKLKKEHFSDDD